MPCSIQIKWPVIIILYCRSVIDIGGIDTEASYPYTGKNSEVCEFNNCTIGAKIKSYKFVSPSGSEQALAKAVAEIGPVSVAVDASGWQGYGGDIFKMKDCTWVNHGVLVVGYTPDYWIVKNSWDRTWGIYGYMHMARNQGNMCLIASYASYPIAF